MINNNCRVWTIRYKKYVGAFEMTEKGAVMELIEQEEQIIPGPIYYIKPNASNNYYETVFSSCQHIEQIRELLTTNKIWQRVS